MSLPVSSDQQREAMLDSKASQQDWNSKFLALVREGFVLSGQDSDFEDEAERFWPDVSPLSPLKAALAYAEHGIAIVPTRLAEKNPGRLVGSSWPDKATTDPRVIRKWFKKWGSDLNLAMHVWASGLLLDDVDYPEFVPDERWAMYNEMLFIPTVSADSDNDPRRGHYIGVLKSGEKFGNQSLVGFNPKTNKPQKYGERRCYRGAAILAPSVHPAAAEGRGYHATGERKPIPLRPDGLMQTAGHYDTERERAPWLQGSYEEAVRKTNELVDGWTGEDAPKALQGPIGDFTNR